jgi:chemotaxis protein CheY-P-specific phosphatase CheC
MKPIIETSLDIFERMGFLFGEQSTPAEIASKLPEAMLYGRVTYTGDRSGSVSVYITERLASLLAENILGLEAGITPTQAEAKDAFTEFLNVFCGNALTDNFGTKQVFNMSMPEIEKVNRESMRAALDDPKASVSIVEEQPVIILFS